MSTLTFDPRLVPAQLNPFRMPDPEPHRGLRAAWRRLRARVESLLAEMAARGAGWEPPL